jgi:RecB family exonuclease
LRADWEQHLPLEHVGVEIPFGFPPVAVPLEGDRRLFVRGFIDRIDRRGRAAVLRDIKTGRARSRRLDPLAPTLDLQLALYAIVAPSLLGDAGGRVGLAAYAYADAGGESERAYATTADIDALLTAGRRWLDVAERLLVARSFPHAVDPEACRYCAFRPVCGEGAVAASRESLAALDPDRPERPFAMLHAVGADG